MDNNQKKATTKAKTKKKPMKVVYISNPMKFVISPSEFRALVQELTGQDSELPDPTKFGDDDEDDVGDKNQTALDASSKSTVADVPKVADPNRDKPERPDAAPFGSFDDVFMSPMFDNFSGTLLPSSLLYESNVDVLRSLDAM